MGIVMKEPEKLERSVSAGIFPSGKHEHIAGKQIGNRIAGNDIIPTFSKEQERNGFPV